MGTGRKSQMEKFQAKVNAQKALDHMFEEKAFIDMKAATAQESTATKIDKYAEANGMEKDKVILAATVEGTDAMGKMFSSSAASGVESMLDAIESRAFTAVSRVMAGMEDRIYAISVRAAHDVVSRMFNGFDRAIGDIIAPAVATQVAKQAQKQFTGEFFSGRKGDYTPEDNAAIDSVNETIQPVVKTSQEAAVTVTEEKKNGRPPRYTDPLEVRLERLLKKHGPESTNASWFKKKGSEENGVYQKYMVQNKGIKGAWQAVVSDTLR